MKKNVVYQVKVQKLAQLNNAKTLIQIATLVTCIHCQLVSTSSNQSFVSSKLFEGLQVSVSVSQQQTQDSSSNDHRSSESGTLAKYLLKLWIQKRLEQIQSNNESQVSIHISTIYLLSQFVFINGEPMKVISTKNHTLISLAGNNRKSLGLDCSNVSS